MGTRRTAVEPEQLRTKEEPEGRRSQMDPEGWRDEAKLEEWNAIVEDGHRLTKVEPEG